jgi:hypothetical protein
MRSYLKKGLVLTALGMAVSGCQELTVPNLNNPERDRALAQPADVEALIAGTWRNAWNRWQGSVDPSMEFSAIADEMTTTAANWGSWTLSSEPRIMYDNNPTYAYVNLAETPYYNIYDGIANIHDGIEAIKKKGIVIDTAGGKDLTPRALAFAKFTEGLLRGYLALMYDKAFLVTEDTHIESADSLKKLEPVSYKIMMDSAVASFKEAIAIVNANPTINVRKEWLYTASATGVNATEFKKLINSYMARYMALNARTPAERAAVDWDAVIAAVDAGITADYSPIGGPNVLQSNYKYYTQLTVCGTCIIYHADNKLVGPADTSGNYQTWLNTPLEQRTRFDIATPDRRITGPGGPTTDGLYFRYRATNQFRADRGLYHQSNYQFYRFKGTYGGKANDVLPAIYKAEMDLLKAEGLYRKGDPASLAAAVTLINKTRVANGQLPAVTVAGVPDAPGCVPKKDDGTCGSLWDALVYEKRIETAGGDQIAFYDARGFGKLLPGTFLHLPIPGRELAVYKMPMYSFGGGGDGSAQ